MNFFPASLTDVGVRLPFGEVTLTQEVQDMLAQHPKPTNVIVGIRPEHLEDAALIDTYARIRALTFEVKVDLVESLGADKYVHFNDRGRRRAVGPARRAGRRIRRRRKRVRGTGFHRVRRLTAGQTMELAFDTAKLTICSTRTPGSNLTIPPAGSGVTDVLAERPRTGHLRRALRPRRRCLSGETRTSASVTFLGVEPIDVLRVRPDVRLGPSGVDHYVSLGCSRHPMVDPTDVRRRPAARPAGRSRGGAAGTDTHGSGPHPSPCSPPRQPSRVWCWCPTR